VAPWAEGRTLNRYKLSGVRPARKRVKAGRLYLFSAVERQSCSCSSSCSFSIPNRHWYEPSDLGEEGERSQSSDFFGSHAPVENEDEDDDEDDSGGTYTATQIRRFTYEAAQSPWCERSSAIRPGNSDPFSGNGQDPRPVRPS
jgi:hypothetical protein